MNRSTGAFITAALLLLVAGTAEARGLGVEVWTDRGNEAVYQPGDQMNVQARASEDAYLLVYEIDTEGFVRVLHPYRGRAEMVEGGRTIAVPDPEDEVELVVQQTVGQSYIVALASYEPFRPLPWFLRPYSAQEEALGYVGEPDDEEGITPEGRIVGDPFVAMERIRRRVLADPEDDESFGTSYTSYYVHQEVKYPRYLCYDCHRPNRWAWWDGFDPYYTDCSVFSFRVNWSWYWGPSYWYGHVPYFVYVYRPDCPPRYTRYFESGVWYSAWDGWNRWCEMWGDGGLRRYKTPPPSDYIPPARWKEASTRMPAERRMPPGYLAGGGGRSRDGVGRLPIGRSRPTREAIRGGDGGGGDRTRWTEGGRVRKPDAERSPGVRSSRDDRGGGGRIGRPGRERGEERPPSVYRPRGEGGSGRERKQPVWKPWFSPAPKREQPKREGTKRERAPEKRGEPAKEPRHEERAPERREKRESLARTGWSPAPERRASLTPSWDLPLNPPATPSPVEYRPSSPPEFQPPPRAESHPSPVQQAPRETPRVERPSAPPPPPQPPRVEAPAEKPKPDLAPAKEKR